MYAIAEKTLNSAAEAAFLSGKTLFFGYKLSIAEGIRFTWIFIPSHTWDMTQNNDF